MADQFVLDNFYQPTSQACVTDLTPPTFAGIAGLVANSNGSLTASWSAASDTNSPIAYEVYIQASTAIGLFNVANRTLSTFSLSRAIFALADGTLLANGVTYFVGVRARDPIGNVDANTASLSAISQGVPSTSVLNAIAGIWDQVRASHTVSGSFGEALQSRVDVDVSTRAPASTALDNTVWTNAKAAFIDAAISSRATDADMATALAGIAAIFSRTDVATSTRATPADISAAQSALTSLINAVAGNVWEQLIASHNTAGTFGANAQTPSINPTQVANAVWDALTAAHTVPGSFGLNAQSPSLNPGDVASAVWDALVEDYQESDTFGELIKQGGSGGGCTDLLATIDSEEFLAFLDQDDTLVATIECED